MSIGTDQTDFRSRDNSLYQRTDALGSGKQSSSRDGSGDLDEQGNSASPHRLVQLRKMFDLLRMVDKEPNSSLTKNLCNGCETRYMRNGNRQAVENLRKSELIIIKILPQDLH